MLHGRAGAGAGATDPAKVPASGSAHRKAQRQHVLRDRCPLPAPPRASSAALQHWHPSRQQVPRPTGPPAQLSPKRCRGVTAMRAMMVEQLGLAMMPPLPAFMPDMACWQQGEGGAVRCARRRGKPLAARAPGGARPHVACSARRCSARGTRWGTTCVPSPQWQPQAAATQTTPSIRQHLPRG